MHRNTAVLIVTLSLVATFLIGIKITRKITGDTTSTAAPSQPTVSGQISKIYTSSHCGVTFEIDPQFTVNEASDAASLVNTKSGEKIEFACIRSFPDRPPLPPDKIESATIAGQLATIYHDKTQADQKSIDLVILQHPTTKLDLIFLGFGNAFKALLNSIKLQ